MNASGALHNLHSLQSHTRKFKFKCVLHLSYCRWIQLNIDWLSCAKCCARHCHICYLIRFSQKFCEAKVIMPIMSMFKLRNGEAMWPVQVTQTGNRIAIWTIDLNRVCWWVQYSFHYPVFQISFKSFYTLFYNFKNFLYIHKTFIDFRLSSLLYLCKFR